MGSHLLEIINKNIDFQKNYIEFELLDTNFSNFAKYISPVVINLENEITGAELSSTALIELYNELIGHHTRLKNYEDEIAAYALQELDKTITFERLEYSESFKEKIAAEQIANYEVLQFLVLRAVDIRKRRIIIQESIFSLAYERIKKNLPSVSGNAIGLHPNGKYAIISDINYVKIGNDSHGAPIFRYDSVMKIYNFSNKYTNYTFEGEVLIDSTTMPDFVKHLVKPVSAIFSEDWQKATVQLSNKTTTMLDFGRFDIVKPNIWYGIKLDEIY